MASAPPLPLSTRLGRGAVLAAAIEVFERKGFAQARVEDILEAANIARRTFYRHFKSKEEVLAALFEVAAGELLGAVREAGSDSDSLAGIHRAIDLYLDYHLRNAGTLRVLIGESMRPDSPLHAMRRTFRAALVQVLDHSARKQGKQLAPFVFVALVSALEGLSVELLETGVTPSDVHVARQTVHALLAKVWGVAGPALPRAKR